MQQGFAEFLRQIWIGEEPGEPEDVVAVQVVRVRHSQIGRVQFGGECGHESGQLSAIDKVQDVRLSEQGWFRWDRGVGSSLDGLLDPVFDLFVVHI